MSIKLKWGDGSPEHLTMLVETYFNECNDKGRMPTTEGICLWLGIERETWYYYQSGKYKRHVPTYLKKRIKDEDKIDNPPCDEDFASVDTMNWQETPLAIAGDGGDMSEWSEDRRLRYAVGDILKRAGMMMAEMVMQESYKIQKSGKNPIFSMFALKATHGYKEEAPYLAPNEVAETQSDSMKIEIMGATPLKIESESGK